MRHDGPNAADREPLDLVYTWVDDREPGYLARLDSFAHSDDDRNPNRTRDNLDILRYSLRSVARHAPWLRHVYLVTARPQVPAWLDRDHPGLSVVFHDQIIPPRGLPTFNSFAIVSYLHHIAGLSRRFVYLEDDRLLGAPLRREDLLDRDDRLLIYPRLRSLPPAGALEDAAASPWNAALAHTSGLLDAAFGRSTRARPDYVPLLIDGGAWSEMIERWPEDFARTRRSRFRAARNAAPEILYPWFMLHTGRARRRSRLRTLLTSYYHGLENSAPVNVLGLGLARLLRPGFISLNDNFGTHPSPREVRRARRFLQALFPEPSPFERTPAR